jgi:CheY-like chemotaxis protein
MEEPLYTGHTILIAEDDVLNYNLFHASLRNTGVTILHAENGQQAIDFCREHPEIDLIIMDGMMPGMNGFDATRQIRMFRPDLPIVLLTAYVSSASIHSAVESGCNDYLSKPINQETLTTTLRKWLINK